MFHPLDELFTTIGCALSFFGILGGMICAQEWLLWCAGIGLALMFIGLGLDKWREWKREQQERVWW